MPFLACIHLWRTFLMARAVLVVPTAMTSVVTLYAKRRHCDIHERASCGPIQINQSSYIDIVQHCHIVSFANSSSAATTTMTTTTTNGDHTARPIIVVVVSSHKEYKKCNGTAFTIACGRHPKKLKTADGDNTYRPLLLAGTRVQNYHGMW